MLPMQVLPHTLPNTVAELQQLLIEKLSIIEQQQKTIASGQSLLKVLEEKLRLLNHKYFAMSSEKNPGQAELQFLNEAELLHAQEILDELDTDEEEPETIEFEALELPEDTQQMPVLKPIFQIAELIRSYLKVKRK